MLIKKYLTLIILLSSVTAFSKDKTLSIKDLKNSTFPKNEINIESDIGDYVKYKSKDISFKVDGIKEYALMSIPKSVKPLKGYPVIILIHGHIPPNLYSTFNSYKYMFDRYASSEFVVIKPDLRSHGRSGSGNNYTVGIEKLYYLEDVLQLITSIETLDFLNAKQIFLMGHSNGGDTTIRVLSVWPDKVKAASMWAPVTVKLEESNFYYKGRGRHKYGLEATTDPKAEIEIKEFGRLLDLNLNKIGINSREEIRYDKYLSNILTPIIIRHADTDKVVPYSWSLKFVKRYKSSGNSQEVKIINYPGDDHNIAKKQSDAQKDDLIWFRTFLEYKN